MLLKCKLLSLSLRWECNVVRPLQRQSPTLPCDSAIVLLGTDPNEPEPVSKRKPARGISSALLLTAQNRVP